MSDSERSDSESDDSPVEEYGPEDNLNIYGSPMRQPEESFAAETEEERAPNPVVPNDRTVVSFSPVLPMLLFRF